MTNLFKGRYTKEQKMKLVHQAIRMQPFFEYTPSIEERIIIAELKFREYQEKYGRKNDQT